MNRFALAIVAYLLLLGMGTVVGAPPNILLIISEDHGPELGCYDAQQTNREKVQLAVS